MLGYRAGNRWHAELAPAGFTVWFGDRDHLAVLPGEPVNVSVRALGGMVATALFGCRGDGSPASQPSTTDPNIPSESPDGFVPFATSWEDSWECPEAVDRAGDGPCGAIRGDLGAQDAGTHLYGNGKWKNFGSFVAAVNLDDDPADELIVTAWSLDWGSDLYAFLDPPPLGRNAEDVMQTVHIHDEASDVFDWYQSTVDLDGDGVEEYQVHYWSAQLYDFSIPRTPGDYSFNREIPPVMRLWATAGYPWTVSTDAYDATGDGIPDLWFSCPDMVPPPKEPDERFDFRTCLLPGPLSGERFDEEFAAMYVEEKNGLRFVDVLSRDFDGDGVRDVLVNGVGSPELEGLVSLVSDPPLVEATYEDVTTHTIVGTTDELLGYVAYDPGDIDGDGYEDLFLSVGLANWVPGPTGFVVFYGPFRTPASHSDCADVRYTAEEQFELNTDAVVAGDFNGDGLPDLSVGSYGDQWLFYSPLPSGSHDMADADARIGTVGYRLGDSSAAGDIDGDGIDDLILGAEWDTNFDYQDGSVFVFYGGRDL